jgi:hypothetical protein
MWLGGFWLVFGSVFLITGILMITVAATQHGRIQKEGQVASGTVLSKSIMSDDKNTGTSYRIDEQ